MIEGEGGEGVGDIGDIGDCNERVIRQLKDAGVGEVTVNLSEPSATKYGGRLFFPSDKQFSDDQSSSISSSEAFQQVLNFTAASLKIGMETELNYVKRLMTRRNVLNSRK